MTTLDALISGSADATSLGFKDKLTGLAGLIAGKLGIVPDLGYDRYRDEAKSRSDNIATENPKTVIASSLLSGLAMGGAGLARASQNTLGAVGALSSIGHSTGKATTIDDLVSSYEPRGVGGVIGSVKRLKAPNLLSGKWDRPDMQVKDVSKLTFEQLGTLDKFNPGHFGISAQGWYNPDRDIGFAIKSNSAVSEHEGIHALKDQISKKYPSGRNAINIIDDALLREIGVGKGGISKDRFKKELLPKYQKNARSDEEIINHLRDGHDGDSVVKSLLQNIDDSILDEIIDNKLFEKDYKIISKKGNFNKAWNKKSKIFNNLTPKNLEEIAQMKDATLDDLLEFIKMRK